MTANSSTPLLEEFDPTIIPFQYEVLKHLRAGFDYGLGVNEMLLSGSVGSAKTILGAHTLVTHALFYPGSQQLIVRRALKDLKNTSWRVMLAHFPQLIKWFNKSEMRINLPNGSIIYGASYDDGNFTRFRSYELSGAIIEEAVENDDPDLYDEILMRVGRLPHVKEKYMMLITNPDSPSHFIHDKFIDKPTKTRSVFYSKTEQNPFLPRTYIDQLKESFDPKMAMRMLDGLWIEIRSDVIYHSYSREKNFKDQEYQVNPSHEVLWAWDFNIGDGKPMSSAFGQYIDEAFHWFGEIVLDGSRTLSVLEEAAARGILDMPVGFVINGDATGAARSSKALHSDYEVIKHFLDNYQTKSGGRVKYRMNVPRANPPIKERHNMMNAYCVNAHGKSRFFVYKTCPTLDKGMRLTALKKGGQYIEDDSKHWQHITTAVGYSVISMAVRPKTTASSFAR